jgi:hypothetical protein
MATPIPSLGACVARMTSGERCVDTDRNLRLANEKVQDVTIKKLTRGNPSMTGKFAELKKAGSSTLE